MLSFLFLFLMLIFFFNEGDQYYKRYLILVPETGHTSTLLTLNDMLYHVILY